MASGAYGDVANSSAHDAGHLRANPSWRCASLERTTVDDPRKITHDLLQVRSGSITSLEPNQAPNTGSRGRPRRPIGGLSAFRVRLRLWKSLSWTGSPTCKRQQRLASLCRPFLVARVSQCHGKEKAVVTCACEPPWQSCRVRRTLGGERWAWSSLPSHGPQSRHMCLAARGESAAIGG